MMRAYARSDYAVCARHLSIETDQTTATGHCSPKPSVAYLISRSVNG